MMSFKKGLLKDIYGLNHQLKLQIRFCQGIGVKNKKMRTLILEDLTWLCFHPTFFILLNDWPITDHGRHTEGKLLGYNQHHLHIAVPCGLMSKIPL
jgi:hypothetical protein